MHSRAEYQAIRKAHLVLSRAQAASKYLSQTQHMFVVRVRDNLSLIF